MIEKGADFDLINKNIGKREHVKESKRTHGSKSKRSKHSRKSKSHVQSVDDKLESKETFKEASKVSATQVKKDKKKFKEDIVYLDEKLKPKYGARLEGLNEQTNNLEKKIDRMNTQINIEMINSNKIDEALEKENERARRLQEL